MHQTEEQIIQAKNLFLHSLCFAIPFMCFGYNHLGSMASDLTCLTGCNFTNMSKANHRNSQPGTDSIISPRRAMDHAPAPTKVSGRTSLRSTGRPVIDWMRRFKSSTANIQLGDGSPWTGTTPSNLDACPIDSTNTSTSSSSPMMPFGV